MTSRILAALIAVAVTFVPQAAPAQSQAASLTGRILDTNGGLPVQGATVELDRGTQKIATSSTDANGVFTFKGASQGEYSVLIVARGYVSTRIPTLFLIDGNTTQINTAIQATNNRSTNLKEIGRVVVNENNHSLQTSTTVNQYIDPSQVQSQAYTHVGYLLARLPGISMHTSPSVGDDMSISIRGFDPSETATLLDGHPIGPIGAFGGANSPGFDYKLAPFWGLSGTSVIMGSGAAGIYGVSTIAGAVDFQTLNPTREAHTAFFQGAGNEDHSMSGISATGSLGKFGYAIASAVQGSTGQFPGGYITQTGNMQSSTYCNSTGGPTCTVPGSGGAPQAFAPPDLTSQNAASNTNFVSGAYTQRNNLVKFNFSASPKTQIQTSFFDTSTWNDKTGNGDQDALSYPYVLNNANSILSGGTNNFTYNGAPTTCSSATIAVLNNSSQGYGCYTAAQYASSFAGPAGGGIGRWNGSHMQDYHARVTQQVGGTQLVVDGFVNNYSMDEHKSPSGPYYEDNYLTHGLLVSDEFQVRNHDVSFGFYSQHQRHATGTNFSDPTSSTANGSFLLTSNNYFIRDQWQNSLKFSTFADLWFQHSVDTGANNFDPRLSLVYRPTPNDVIRLTGGRSYSEPDPALLSTLNPSPQAPLSVNPLPIGQLTPIGSAGNPYLRPETAGDEELAYGHRFSHRLQVQLDAYNTLENNAILTGTLPITDFPQYNGLLNSLYPGSAQTWLQNYLNRVGTYCSCTASAADLGWTTYANAAQALYRGFDIDATVGVLRNVTLDAKYGVQSASYRGISNSILANNLYLYNDSQIAHIPLQKALTTLVYENPSGFKAEADETYVGNNNEFVRPAFWYTDASISKTTGPIVVTFGVSNLFNQAVTQYGEIGAGAFVPQNQFGAATNAVQEGGSAELYGLVPRQAWVTVTIKN